MPPAALPPLQRHSLLGPLLPPSLARVRPALPSLRGRPVEGFSARSRRPLPRHPHPASLAVVLSPRRRPSLPPPPQLQEVACLARSLPPRQPPRIPPRPPPRLPRRLAACSAMPVHRPLPHLPRRPLRLPAEACSGSPLLLLRPPRHLPVLRRLPRPSQPGRSSAVPRRPLRHSRLRQRRQAALLRPLHQRRLHRPLRPREPACSAPSPLKARPPPPRSPRTKAERPLRPPVPAHSVLRPLARPRGSPR